MRKLKQMFCLLTIMLFLSCSVLVFSATDPFAPKNQITIWVQNMQDNLNSIESFLSQAGFSAVYGDPRGKAVITNIENFSLDQLKKLEAFRKQGGKLILLGSRNFPGITFLGTQTVSTSLMYIEVTDLSFWQKPNVREIPDTTKSVSLFACAEPGTIPLAVYYKSDGVTPSHVEPLNTAVLKTAWGLYFSFDWFERTFLEDPFYRQLLIYWLRKTIWG